MHQLCRAYYVNVKFELIQLQGQVSRVPELSLASFPRLGTLLRTCSPVDLTDTTADFGYVAFFVCPAHSSGSIAPFWVVTLEGSSCSKWGCPVCSEVKSREKVTRTIAQRLVLEGGR